MRIAIGINAKTRNNCKANLFIYIGEHIYPRAVKLSMMLQAKLEKSTLAPE